MRPKPRAFPPFFAGPRPKWRPARNIFRSCASLFHANSSVCPLPHAPRQPSCPPPRLIAVPLFVAHGDGMKINSILNLKRGFSFLLAGFLARARVDNPKLQNSSLASKQNGNRMRFYPCFESQESHGFPGGQFPAQNGKNIESA